MIWFDQGWESGCQRLSLAHLAAVGRGQHALLADGGDLATMRQNRRIEVVMTES